MAQALFGDVTINPTTVWLPAKAQGRNSAPPINRKLDYRFTKHLRPRGLWPARLLCPWDSPGKNTGVDCHSFLQGIFPTQGFKPGLLHCRQILYLLSDQGSPRLQATQPNLNPISAPSHIIFFQFTLFLFFFMTPFMLDFCFLLTLIILGLPTLVLFTTISKQLE